mgnify:CR=1 FL=1
MLEIENDGKYISIFLVQNNKPLLVPREQCKIEDFYTPSKESVAYWKHYGYNRLTLNLE